MTLHWWHVAIAWALVLGGFGVLTLMTLHRAARARRRLAELDPRQGSATRRDRQTRRTLA